LRTSFHGYLPVRSGLQIGDQLVDASIAYDLRSVAKQFENNDFIYQIK